MSVRFHFEDLDGNVFYESETGIIELHDFLDVKRGSTSDPFQFLAVNDGQDIPMLTIRTGDSEPLLSLIEDEDGSNEVNFPLPMGGSKLIICVIDIDTNAFFGSDEALLNAYASMKYNTEDF